MSAKDLIKKWEKAEGKMSINDVKDPYMKENMAKLLENQEGKDFNGNDVFMTEASQGAINTGTLGGFTNGAADSDSWRFRPVALALVRRTFPDLFANKCVGVQAMSTPVGLAYALRVLYNTDAGIEAAWDQVDRFGGYTGSQAGTSATLAGVGGNTSASDGTSDTSGTGANTSASEAWTIGNNCANTITASSTSGTTTITSTAPTGCGSYPELKIRLDQLAITAGTRKLAASFSLEAAQDIRAMHGIDIEREMVNILQYEVTAELDREIIYRMKRAAVTTANGGEVISAYDCTPSMIGYGRWAGEQYMSIVASIVHQANKIAIKTRRGAGNFAVVSPSIASCLQAAGHQWVQYKQDINPSTVMAQIGKLNGTIDIYRDQYAETDFALVGYKGAGISDCGLIFSPYIMGLNSKAIEPSDFTPRIGVMSRYAITDTLLGSGRYYRLIPYYNVSAVMPTA